MIQFLLIIKAVVKYHAYITGLIGSFVVLLNSSISL